MFGTNALTNKWWRLNPRPVVIPCTGFQIRTNTHGWKDDSWFYPEGHRAILGALVTCEGEQRVYMVTERNKEYGTKLWPHLVGYLTDLVVWEVQSINALADED